jgi:broad specificity phosphatase PhoE
VLLIVRHGRTAANASGLLLGRNDPPLDDVGAAQAAALAEVVGPIDRVVSSPLQRCRSTAACIAGERIGVEVDERLIELDYGEYDGRPLGDLPPGTWERWRSDITFTPPGGESIAALGRRVRSLLEELAPAAIDGNVVAVTHVSPVKAAVAWALGVGDEIAWRAHVSPGSITRIRVAERGPLLAGFNDVAHIGG